MEEHTRINTEFSAYHLADWRETNSCIHVRQEHLSRPSPGTDVLCSIRGERKGCESKGTGILMTLEGHSRHTELREA